MNPDLILCNVLGNFYENKNSLGKPNLRSVARGRNRRGRNVSAKAIDVGRTSKPSTTNSLPGCSDRSKVSVCGKEKTREVEILADIVVGIQFLNLSLTLLCFKDPKRQRLRKCHKKYTFFFLQEECTVQGYKKINQTRKRLGYPP